MWATIFVLRDPTQKEGTRLREFVFNLYSHNMYEPISNSLIARQGFEKKEISIIQTKDDIYFKAMVFFDTEENCKDFFDDESIESLYEFVALSAEAENFTCVRLGMEEII